MMRGLLAYSAFVIATAAGPWAYAQTPTAQAQRFEVASVKPSDPSGAVGPLGSFPMVLPPVAGRFRVSNVPLRQLLRLAYEKEDHQFVGGSESLLEDRFDIVAKTEDGFTGTMRDMVRRVSVR